MPEQDDAPFYVNKGGAWHQATPGDLDGAIDISGWLLHNVHFTWQNIDTFSKVRRILSGLDEQTKNIDFAQYNGYWFKPVLKISMAMFADLQNGLLLNRLIKMIREKLLAGYTIGIDFREVYLVDKNQPLPARCKPCDLIVHTRDDYKFNVSRLAYQLPRALFKLDQNLENMVFSTSKPEVDFKRSLLELQPFQHAFEAIAVLNNNFRELSNSRQVVMAFGPEVSIEDLRSFFNVIQNEFTEFVLVLQGEVYREQNIREDVRYYVSKYMLHFRRFVHVILVTDAKTPYSVVELVPDLNTEVDGFSLLAHEAGYYLSD